MANEKKDNPTGAHAELGVSSFRHSSGYIHDEFQRELVGLRGRRKYREMRDSDPTIGAMLFAITSIVRTASWDFDAAEGDTEGKYSEWLEDTLTNMPGMTWDDVISDALNMIPFGFAIQEIVTMPKKDGTIGLRKLAPRRQDTVVRFDLDSHGELLGVWQTAPNGAAGDIYIPAFKLVHYRMDYNSGNPEGRSLIRNAYKPYHFINTISVQEAIGVERDLSGLPVIKAPSGYLQVAANRAAMERIARDLKFNDQGGLVLPSDVYLDSEGRKTNVPQFEIQLVSSESSGGRIDTDRIIQRHVRQMAATILAQFITLGDGKGSYALSENQTDLFLKAIESILECITQTLERQLIPLLWTINSFPEDMMPCVRPGKIAPEDLQVFGDFIQKVSGAGIPLNDRATEEFIRDKAGFPPPPEEDDLLREVSDPPDDDPEDTPADDPKPEDVEAAKGFMAALKKLVGKK